MKTDTSIRWLSACPPQSLKVPTPWALDSAQCLNYLRAFNATLESWQAPTLSANIF
jgi:hypothetical protein